MPYYAHIRQDENGQTIYQTVAEHLTGTAALCREFAADFGAEADGALFLSGGRGFSRYGAVHGRRTRARRI